MSMVQVNRSQSQQGQVGRADTFPGRWELWSVGQAHHEPQGHHPKLRLSPSQSIP